jgi:hypothetical protein
MAQPKESAEFTEWKAGRDRVLARFLELRHYTETIAINTPELSAKEARKLAEQLVDELDQLKIDEHQALRRYEMANPQPNPYDLSEVLEGEIELPPTSPLGARPHGPQLPAAPGFWPLANMQSNARQEAQPPRLPVKTS